MKHRLIILTLLCSFGFALHSQEFEVEAIQETGPIDERINLVFMGDGYLEEDLNKYVQDVQLVMLELFVTVPFKEYRSYFNVYAIKVPSNARGASRDPNNLIDNYFGSTFNYAGIERLLVPTKNDVAASVLATNFPEYDQAFILVNDDKYGGSGGWLATSSTNQQAGQISIHEIGHSLVGLADEYWAGDQFARETHNMTQNTNPSTVKWRNWHGDRGIGIYPYEGGASWNRPHQNCKMEVLGVPFCAVCREAFIHTFYDLTNTIETIRPEQQNDLTGTRLFSANGITPNPNTLRNFWLLDGDTVARNVNGHNLAISTLSNGSHTLSFNAVDLTDLSRRDEIPMDIVTWTINVNNTNASASGTIGRQNIRRSSLFNQVTSIDEDFIAEIGFKTYPNPVADQLRVHFVNPTPASFDLKLIDLNGKVLQAAENPLLPQGEQEFLIDTSHMTQGMFIVQMQLGDRLVIQKVLK